MAQTNVNIRMDENLKHEFDSICQDLGLTMTAAFTVFAKTVVRRQRIPFEIAKEAPNTETVAAIEEVRKMMEEQATGKTYEDFSALIKEIDT